MPVAPYQRQIVTTCPESRCLIRQMTGPNFPSEQQAHLSPCIRARARPQRVLHTSVAPRIASSDLPTWMRRDLPVQKAPCASPVRRYGLPLERESFTNAGVSLTWKTHGKIKTLTDRSPRSYRADAEYSNSSSLLQVGRVQPAPLPHPAHSSPRPRAAPSGSSLSPER